MDELLNTEERYTFPVEKYTVDEFLVIFKERQKKLINDEIPNNIFEQLKNLNKQMMMNLSKKNFQKFMISEEGKWLDVVYSKENPYCDKIINWLKS